MCGLFGAINLGGVYNHRDYQAFVESTDMVGYRGPDARGYKVLSTEGACSEKYFNIFIGHRRLSIIDLSEAGNQPFNDGDDLWIIFNGEIFNYIELRDELKRKGHKFKSKTDTEVLLKVYREYGASGFERLNGMWAFAIIDMHNKKVILSRDRFSIKPLYFYQKQGKLYFSSEIKQLLPFIEKKEINLSILFIYLKQGLLDWNDETFFKDIYKVPPMHSIAIDLRTKSISKHKYWDYTSESMPEEEGDVIGRFRELFVDSVRIRLRSDVQVGCLLSGGLDSSSIAVVAGTLLENGINCFSIISEDKKYSEERFIDVIGRGNNINSKKLSCRDDMAWDSMESVVWHQDEPFAGFSVIAQNMIFELIKRHSDIKVILSGQGGDETLCGYLKFFFFYLKEAFSRKDMLPIFKNIILSIVHRTVLWQFSLADAKRYIKILQKDKTDFIDKALMFKSPLETTWESTGLKARQILDIDKFSVPALAHYEDRNSMGHSIEVRHPFLDHRLVNFALNMPSQIKIQNGWTKYALRKALPELPEEIAWRRDKQGFITPEIKWIRYDFRERITELFNGSRLHEAGLVDKNGLLRGYENFIKGSKLIAYTDISRFITSEMWYRRFFC